MHLADKLYRFHLLYMKKAIMSGAMQPRVRIILFWLCLVGLYEGLHDVCVANPLESAQQLASTDYSGWTYGSNPAKKQIDCVQFVQKVLEAEIKRPLTSVERNAVLIAPAPVDLEQAVVSQDPITRGVQHAIVDVLKQGTAKAADQAEIGDFIQYWMKKADGTWFGHSGIVSKVWTDQHGHKRISVYGAHKSLGGIGDNDFGNTGLDLGGPNRFIYLAHLDSGH